MTVQQLAAHYGLLVQSVLDVNAPSFVETLRVNYIDIGISLQLQLTLQYQHNCILQFAFSLSDESASRPTPRVSRHDDHVSGYE